MHMNNNDLRIMRAPISLPYRALTRVARVQFPVLRATLRIAEQLMQRCAALDDKGQSTGLKRLERAVLRWLTGAQGNARCTKVEFGQAHPMTPTVSGAGWASLRESAALRNFSFLTEEETGAETAVQEATGRAHDLRMTQDQAAHRTGPEFQRHSETCLCSKLLESAEHSTAGREQ
mgnify:CR=1 FL=1